jgi:hypothetical protein
MFATQGNKVIIVCRLCKWAVENLAGGELIY